MDSKNIEKQAEIRIWLRVENNNKFVRGKSKTRESIELYLSLYYNMKQKDPRSWEYTIFIPYSETKDLEEKVYEILRELEFEADLNNCFIEADAHCDELDLHW
jgi:hypothetical protein